MLKTSIFISFLVKLYAFFKSSWIYKAIDSIITFLGRAFSGCLLFKGIKQIGNEYPKSDSVFYKLLIRFCDGIFSVTGKIREFFKKRTVYKIIKFLFSNSVIFKYENIFYFGFFMTFVWPHKLWNNVYGLAFAVVILCIYLFMMNKPDVKSLWTPYIFFVASVVLAVLISVDVKDSIRVLMLFITSFAMCITVFGVLSSEKRLEKMCMAIYCAFVVMGIVAVYQKIVGVEVDILLTDVRLNGNMGRVFATWANPNDFAEFLIIFFPFCFVYAITRKTVKLKTLAVILLLIPFLALLFTYSRSGWIGFAVTVITFVILYNKKWLPMVVVIALMLIPLLPESVLDRVMTIGNLSDTSSSYRIDIWTGTLQMLERFWYSGVGLGPGAFSKIYPQFAVESAAEAPHTHMLFLEIFAEMGIIGLICFAFLIISLVSRCSAVASKTTSGAMKLYTIAAAASMMGILTIGFAEYVWFYPRVMFAFFTAIGMAMAAVKISAGKNYEG